MALVFNSPTEFSGAIQSLQHVLLGIAGLVVLVVITYGFHPVKRYRYRHIPGPRPWWLLGSLPDILRKGQHVAYKEWEDQYGPVFKVFLGATCAVVISDPALARRLASRCPTRMGIKFLEVGEERAFNQYNMVLASGEKWKTAHNAWGPFFSKASLANHVPPMVQSAEKMAAGILAAHAESGAPIDIWRAFGLLTLHVVGSTAFGVDFNTLDTEDKCMPGHGAVDAPRIATPAQEIVRAARAIFDSFDLSSVWMGLLFICPELDFPVRWAANLLPTKRYRTYLRGRKVLRDTVANLMADYRRQQSEQGESIAGADGKSGLQRGVDPGSFLALMARTTDKSTGTPFPDIWCINQAYTFIGAGYETTANALAFSVYLLAAHPEKEAKLLAEIDAFGSDRALTAGDLEGFPYTTAVWKESMRVYPPGALYGRQTDVDMQLGQFFIPQGTQIHGNIYCMHRNSQHWLREGEFLPERFMPGAPEAEGCNFEAYMPFGEGPRKCMGHAFATQEGILTLIRLYQQFVFRLTPGQVPLRVKTVATLGPAEGVYVTVHRRAA